MSIRPLVLLAALAVSCGLRPLASAQTATSFTFQGQLQSSGAPANGTYDIRFNLYDAATSGTQLGATVCLDNVPVTNGLFTVILDFGAQFPGAARWLELGIRPDTTSGNCSTGAVTTLSPRQVLNPTPYAAGLTLPQSLTAATPSAALAITNSTGDGLNGFSAASGRSGVYGVNSLSDGFGVFGRNTSSGNYGFLGGGQAGVIGEDDNAGGRGGWFATYSPTGEGVFGQANSPSGVCYGVRGVTGSLGGTGVLGSNSASTNFGSIGGATTGVYGENHVTGGAGGQFYSNFVQPVGTVGAAVEANGVTRGVEAFNSGTDNGEAMRATQGTMVDYWYELGGAAILGLSAHANAVAAITEGVGGATAVAGYASSPTGTTYGGFFSVSSPQGIGVIGVAPTASGLAPGITVGPGVMGDSGTSDGVVGLSSALSGVYGLCSGAGGAGVSGRHTPSQNYGALGISTAGVFGLAMGANNFGVYGENDIPGGYGGYFVGRGYFSDFVGLGIQQPSVPLQVAGGTDLTLSGGGNIVVGQIGAANLVMDNNEIQARANGNAASLYINANGGNVGIGTNNAQGFQLAVNGTAAKPGGGSWSTLSDARLKKNIQPLPGALDKLLQLRGVTFEYIDPTSINELPGTHTGMIAQEVEPLFPQWVTTGPTGLKSIAFSGFEALTVEALRDLRAESSAAHKSDQARITDLEQENQQLRQDLVNLRAAVDALAAQASSK
jgi:hypothetical protein